MAMTLDAASNMIAAARARAEELGVRVAVAVVDAGGHLVALVRMDGTKFICAEIAYAKAYTAAAFGTSTLDLGRAAQPHQELYGINTFGMPKIAVFGGGVPVTDDARAIVGGVGVSGSTTETDCLCAEATVAAYGKG